MTPGEFLNVYVEQAGHRTMTIKINGWNYEIFMKLAALTSYIKFNCNFNEAGLCKQRTNSDWHKSNPKATMCCCQGCRACVGYIYHLPADPGVIKVYADNYDMETGFWRADKGCILPRSHRSSTCLTYNCDYNEKLPDAQQHLLKCLRHIEGNVCIKGKPYTGGHFNFPAAMKRWLKEPPTYKIIKRMGE